MIYKAIERSMLLSNKVNAMLGEKTFLPLVDVPNMLAKSMMETTNIQT